MAEGSLPSGGRLDRAGYFFAWLSLLVVGNLLEFAASSAGVSGLSIILVIVALAVSLWLAVLRLSDIGESGWMSLLIFVPLVNLWFQFHLFFAQSGAGSNATPEQAPSGPGSSTLSQAMQAEGGSGRQVVMRVFLRTVPWLLIAAIFTYLDRVNIGFAARQMNRALSMTFSSYGVGANLFFTGYVLFAIPVTLLVHYFGGRVLLIVIMIATGLVAMSLALVQGSTGFMLVRFTLGLVEAGFLPCALVYLSQWLPSGRLGQAYSILLASTGVGTMLGGPLSGALLALGGTAGLDGWQWLFVLEGLPSVAVGAIGFACLANQPRDAAWLTQAARTWLTARIEDDRWRARSVTGQSSSGAEGSIVVVLLVWCAVTLTSSLIFLATPMQFRRTGVSGADFQTMYQVTSAIGMIGLVAMGFTSDLNGERIWHCFVPLAAMVVLLLVSCLPLSGGALLVVATTLGIAATVSRGVVLALAVELMPTRYTPVLIAAVLTVGNLFGFIAPYWIGLLRDDGAGLGLTIAPALAFSVAAAAGLLLIRTRRPRARPLPL